MPSDCSRRVQRDRRRSPRGGRRSADQAAFESLLQAANSRLQSLANQPLVLVVDDYADERDMIAMYLEWVGFRVQQASDGREALDIAARLLPDVIVLDLVLPGLDGFAIMAHLKETPRTQHIKIVVQSGHVLNDVRARVMSAGASLFLPKPCSLDVMTLQLATLISAGAQHARAVV